LLVKDGYRVYAMDMPGFGKSESCPVAPTSLLYDFILQKQLSKPVLLGPSMGGSICLDYYFTWPDTVAGMILVGTVA